MSPRRRNLLIWLAVLAVLVAILAATGAFEFGQPPQRSGWSSARQELNDLQRQLEASPATDSATSIRDTLANTCLSATQLKPNGSSDEKTVRRICAANGHPLPAPTP